MAAIPALGFIRPSAQYFTGREDFWATVDPTKDTVNEIEESLISATWIYPVNYQRETVANDECSPLIQIIYEFYHFTQYGAMRDDESETPDVYSRKVLRQHQNFIDGWLDLIEAYQRYETIAELDEDEFAVRRMTPIVQVEDAGTQVICEFIPGIVGYDFRLQETVEIRHA